MLVHQYSAISFEQWTGKEETKRQRNQDADLKPDRNSAAP